MPTLQAQGHTRLSEAESAGSGNAPGTIHNLPLEVLSKIFALVLPTDRELQSHKQPHMFLDRRTRLINLNPFLLCSTWRTGTRASHAPAMETSVHRYPIQSSHNR